CCAHDCGDCQSAQACCGEVAVHVGAPESLALRKVAHRDAWPGQAMGPLHLVNFNYRMAGAMVNLMTVVRMSAVDHARLPGFFTFLQRNRSCPAA
ncbi:MAG: hypothetical protein KAI80_04375, partial [Hyphomicrobiaceae bacterium]|nr:hypothetical protein [Hyphomicrobiaceae bacterium]